MAQVHKYICADTLTYVGTVTCGTVDKFTFASGVNAVVVDDVIPYIPSQTNTVYYLTWTVDSGAGTVQVDDGVTVLFTGLATTVSEMAMISTGGTTNVLNFGRPAGKTFLGVISGVCIDNDGVSCAGAANSTHKSLTLLGVG